VLWVKKAVLKFDRARPGLFECRLGDGIMHRAKPVAKKLNDYFVIINVVGIIEADEPTGRGKSSVDQNHLASNITAVTLLPRKMPSLPGKGR